MDGAMSFFYNVVAILLTLLTCILIAYFFQRLKFFSYIEDRDDRFSSIDGMRGFLAIFVFFHHFIITWYWKNTGYWSRPPEDYYQNFGKVGVAIFFMVTGFLFITRLINSDKQVDWYKLIESRLFRIFPLYLFAFLIILIVVAVETGFELNVELHTLAVEVLRWLVFYGAPINDFINTKIIIAGVDWSLKYEWIFYFSLPLISILLSRGWLFVFLLNFLLLFLFVYPVTFYSINTKYFLLFSIGGFAAYLCKNLKSNQMNFDNPYISSVCMLALVFSIFYPNTLDLYHIVSMTVFFVLIALGNNLFGLFSLKCSILLGEISYSIYLLHGVLLYLIFSLFNIADLSQVSFHLYLMTMPIACSFILLISCATFLFIEKPGVAVGKKYYLSAALSKVLGRR